MNGAQRNARVAALTEVRAHIGVGIAGAEYRLARMRKGSAARDRQSIYIAGMYAALSFVETALFVLGVEVEPFTAAGGAS